MTETDEQTDTDLDDAEKWLAEFEEEEARAANARDFAALVADLADQCRPLPLRIWLQLEELALRLGAELPRIRHEARRT